MKKEDILNKLQVIINEETGIENNLILENKKFIDDLDIDSISMMTIIVNAEEKFKVSIPDEKVKNLLTVGDAVQFVLSALKEK